MPPVPDASAVLARAQACATLCCRAWVEQGAEGGDAAAIHARLCDWAATHGLAAAMSPAEAALLATPVGGLDDQALIDASWQAEPLYVFAWALGLHAELPPDRLAAPGELAGLVGVFAAVAHVPALRDSRDIAVFAARQRALRWRLETFEADGEARGFAALAGRSGGAMEVDDRWLEGGDLALEGRRIDRVAPAVVGRCLGIARERERAAAWLLGSAATDPAETLR
jgi:hypothetical protein